MRVVHLVQFFQRGYVGGMQAYVARLAREQRRQGLDASVLTVLLPPSLARAGPHDSPSPDSVPVEGRRAT